MNFSTRFGKGVLVACMAAVAACTSTGDDGKTSGTELNVVFPGGTLGDFEIGRVTVTASCDGDTNTYPQNESGDPIGNVIPSMPNDDDGDGQGGGTQFQTDLEFENSDAGAEIWHTFTDMLGLCQLKVEAYDDGELFCVGGGAAEVFPGRTASVNVVIKCDVSQNIDTGSLDLRGTTVTGVGNFCPLFNSLELIPDDIPLVANELYPMQDTTELWVCGLDSGDVGTIQLAQGILASCTDQDPKDPAYQPAFDRCDVSPDPNRVTYTCKAEILDVLGGNVIGDSSGVFSDPANGGAGQDGDGDPTTYNGLCLAGLSGGLLPDSKGFFTCDTAGQPGQPVRITCGGDDGDNDCYKERSHDLDCPGQNLCDPFPAQCVDPDPTDCTVKTACDATVGGDSCVDTDAPAGKGCTTTGGGPGECDNAGTCVATGCASDPECAAGVTDPCMTSTCNLGTGICNAPVADNELGSCTNDAGGPGQCVAGSCDCTAAVCECESNTDCAGGDECNDVACDATAGTCGSVVPKAACTACGAAGDVCFGGTCSTPATFSNNFDVSNSVFRAYNPLLADDATCSVPDLAGSAKCIQVDATGTPPQIQGGVAFTDNGGGDWAVQIQQDLVFEIAAAIAGATVDITTESQSTINGTGTGDVAAGDSIVMDSLGLAVPDDNFNMDVTAASGTVLCQAWNRIFAGPITPCDSAQDNWTTDCNDPLLPCPACPLFATSSGGQTCGFLVADQCDPTELSDVICDAADLGPAAGATCVNWPQDTSVQSEAGCLVNLPKNVDRGYREVPPWTFQTPTTPGSADECNALNMQLLAGPTTVSGWYVGNPDEGSSQFTALAGVQQP